MTVSTVESVKRLAEVLSLSVMATGHLFNQYLQTGGEDAVRQTDTASSDGT